MTGLGAAWVRVNSVAELSPFLAALALTWTGYTKEYLLVIEGSVPPFVVHRKHSPNLSLPALSAVIQTDRYCKMLQTERREVG